MTSEMHFVTFHPEVASCLLSRGKRKYAPLGMRLIWKYIRNYFLVYKLISHFLSYLQNFKEFKAKILDLQPEKYGLSFDIKKCTTSGWALGDENVIGIRAFNSFGEICFLEESHKLMQKIQILKCLRVPYMYEIWEYAFKVGFAIMNLKFKVKHDVHHHHIWVGVAAE